ncbi:hypothetical protein [Alkalihalophilus marmarensis]|uniref:hypothetical protein n=1 Tax=Alkalihalophilus marmarensis TaxID=521377 RepID=UPI002E20CF0E|nr:hypothetical protein [Alkalihalophilus marmarensis]
MREIRLDKRIWISLCGLLLIGFLIWLFFSFIRPIQLEKEAALVELEYEQAQLAGVIEEAEEKPLEVIESSMMIQRKLPVRPLVDQLLLTFARAEGIADAYILSIDIQDEAEGVWFGETGETSIEVEQDQEQDNEPEELEDFIELEEEEEPVPSAPPEAASSLEGLEVIRFVLRVRTNEYAGLARFAEELDRNDRLMSIDSITYAAPSERVLVEDEQEALEFLMTVSAFYYPIDEPDLEQELPQVDYPRPANKSSPLYNQ